MANIKDMIKEEIRTYERDRDQAAKESSKQAVMQSCYNEFVGILKAILNQIEREDQENG